MPQRSLYLVVALVIVTGAAYLAFDAWSPAPPPPAPTQPPQPPAPDTPAPLPQPVVQPAIPELVPAAPARAQPPVAPLPPLAQSDDEVRAKLLAEGMPPPWLAREGLLQRAATVLVNVSNGTLPQRQLAFLAPPEPFKVVKEGERFFVDPAGYARYTPLMDTLEGIPPERFAAFIRRYEPLLDEALAQLGERDTVAQFLEGSSARVLARTPVVGRVELVRPNVLYQYADPALEAASELDKQLLRVGPDNLRRLQRYVQRLQEAWDASSTQE